MKLTHVRKTVVLVGMVSSFWMDVGCSENGQRAAVSGTVLVDQEPLEEGAINFFPIEGTQGPSVGAIITKGEYHIPRNRGVIIGKNRVEIRGFRLSGRKIRDHWDRTQWIDEKVNAFPPEFNSKSTLVREIHQGDNTLDFELAGSKKK